MVRLQIMSDLHIELHDHIPSASEYITPSADVLILAGDIGRIHKYEQLRCFLKDLCSMFQIVLYVPGNHEFYKVDSVEPKSVNELLEDLLKIKEEIPNLYILNRSSVVIGNVCIAGCTLWTQSAVHIPQFIVRIKDIDTATYNSMFCKDLKYIEQMITYCQNKKLKLVVVSHHCPTHSVGRKKPRDKFKTLYTSNLDYLLDSSKVDTWICGHIHSNFDHKTKNGTRLVSNQKGKPKDNLLDYSKTKVISV